MKYLIGFLIFGVFFSCAEDVGIGESATVINGSYSKMITIGDYIYAIHDEDITTIDISDPEKPIQVNVQVVGFTIENIFHHEGVLFVGAEEGLTIYEISIDGIPIKKSSTAYFQNEIVTSCDPVIASGNFAYITLSVEVNSGCGGFSNVNELRIYDISDLSNPTLLSTTPLKIPKGLSLDGDYLFVCEKNNGLSVLDVRDPFSPIITKSFSGFESYDVIAKDGLLLVVCPEELRQYDYTDIDNIYFLSGIEL